MRITRSTTDTPHTFNSQSLQIVPSVTYLDITMDDNLFFIDQVHSSCKEAAGILHMFLRNFKVFLMNLCTRATTPGYIIATEIHIEQLFVVRKYIWASFSSLSCNQICSSPSLYVETKPMAWLFTATADINWLTEY